MLQAGDEFEGADKLHAGYKMVITASDNDDYKFKTIWTKGDCIFVLNASENYIEGWINKGHIIPATTKTKEDCL